MTTVTIILLISAILFAAFIVWMLLRSYSGQKQAVANDRLQQQYLVLVRLQTDYTNLKLEKESLQQQYIRTDIECQFLNEQNAISKRYQKENEILQNQLALFKAKFQAAEEKLETQKKEMQELGDRFRSEFRNLAQSILEEKTQKFTLLNEEKMNAILTPLKAQLVDFKQKVEDTYDKESKERFSLGREVQRLIEMSQLVSQEASNLTTALKGNN
ncbi:MAG TPA: DNA recombination protein RmuC, partial [Puia sp.]|nr:DNA recombination protein RmuC [Puia sp.]